MPDHAALKAGLPYETRVGGQRLAFTLNINKLLDKKFGGLRNFGEGRPGLLSAKVCC